MTFSPEWTAIKTSGRRCCDDSPNQHASKHAAATDHKVIRSAEPGEMWAYCYEHNALIHYVAAPRR